MKLPPESPLRDLARDIGAAKFERDRVLSPAEIWRFWRATETEGLEGRSKGGRDRIVPLSKPAIDLLNRVSALGTVDLVFGSTLYLDQTMKRVRKAMRGEAWQPRDLRRTAATLCARLGADPFGVALVLGHAKSDARMPGVTAVYLRWNYEERVRDILERVGDWVVSTVSSPSEPGDVLPFERNARA